MTDRKPGAPGQFKAVITQQQLQKLQNGEQFVLTLTRDDQPITEGTPYSKAAVLPDELATKLCPDVLDPTPADALAALLPVNGNGVMTGALRMGNHRITGIGSPTDNGDALPKGYTVPVAEGGTGATSAVNARKNLGLTAFSTFQKTGVSDLQAGINNVWGSVDNTESFIVTIKTSGGYSYTAYGHRIDANTGYAFAIGQGNLTRLYSKVSGTWTIYTISKSAG